VYHDNALSGNLSYGSVFLADIIGAMSIYVSMLHIGNMEKQNARQGLPGEHEMGGMVEEQEAILRADTVARLLLPKAGHAYWHAWLLDMYSSWLLQKIEPLRLCGCVRL
jgi:hypothetical protein